MSEKSYNFQKLTPIKNAKLKVYDDALNFVFKDDDIRNVAITGAYSAGKSSIIESYKSARTDIQFLHISLAHFETTESTDINSKDYCESVLEGKILNQLIHQINPSRIPQTNFKVKQKVSADKVFMNTIIITIFIILVTYISLFKNWRIFVLSLTPEWLRNILMWTTSNTSLLIGVMLCIIIFGITTYGIITTQKHKNIFRKVNLQGNEIEIFEENEDSYFDKYLNEVLYLFDNSNVDAIVFEDMDRYNANGIFQKLREVNTLINNKKKKDNKATLRFFYLLRDDIFASKDRTKFFDFIIPIVPVIDGSNSYDQFIEHFKQGGIYELFEETFLQGLSLYVDDMRILKNIYNEFVIYHNRIQSTELNSNKLLAIIAYKNIFPRDFSDLQLGMGFVHTLFQSKESFTRREIKIIDDKILEHENEIIQTRNELLDNIDELDALYQKPNTSLFEVAGKLESSYNSRSEFIRAMKSNPNAIKQYNLSNGIRTIYNIQDMFNELMKNKDYIERKQAIERKSGDKTERINDKIQTLQKQKLYIQSSRLKEIITKDNIDAIFSITFTNEIGKQNKFEEIKVSPYFPLIKYLVRNGYIDETYPDYMTYFYEHSLSRIDKIFLRSVTDQLPKEYTYGLKNPQLVLSKLRVIDFDNTEILNFDLLCYLLKSKSCNNIYLNRFFQQLMKTKNYEFIGDFMEFQRETGSFVENVNNIWPSIFQCLLTESSFTHVQKKHYAIGTLYYSSDEDIKKINENSCLSKFISESPDFLDITTPNINKIINGLSLIGVKFAWINYDLSNKELFMAVYKNNLYQMSFDLISLMLVVVYGIEKSNDFNNRNYSIVSSKPNESLAQYVNGNINEYMCIILENCGEYITDEEHAALLLLNNPDIASELKKEYIRILNTTINRLETIADKELWSLLLEQKKVCYSGNNILNYFFMSNNGLDCYLIQFINSSYADLKFNNVSINEQFGENSDLKFFDDILNCNQLTNERYKLLLQELSMKDLSFSKSGISEEKVQILIELEIIPMTEPILLFIRENYPDQLIYFITCNINEYTNGVISENNFNLDEMLLILEENVADKYKVKLLKFTKAKLTIKSKRYSDSVKLFILYNNLDVNDISFLLECYSNEGIDIKAAIKSISIDHIVNITAQHYIPLELLTELLASDEVENEVKKELFATFLPNMNEVQVKEYLKILKMNDYLSLFNLKRPKFKKNNFNERILTIFKKKHWITRFEIDKDEPDYYRANGRKVHNIYQLL